MFLASPQDDPIAQALFDEATAEEGYVPNYVRLWSVRPDIHEAFGAARKLLNVRTNLSPREIAILNVTTASRLEDSYCSIAWGTRLAHETDAPTAVAVLGGAEAQKLNRREQALLRWAKGIVENASATTQEDVDGLREAGFTDRDIFDATLFVAFRLAFCTVNGALGAQPDWQLAEKAPAEVLAGVTYGRPVEGVAAS